MSYLVIARKYRPQRFSEVVGQDHVTQTLINAIQQNRIAHAYIFCGPRGTGKTTIARIFAKCLNCSNGPRVDFDPDDPICKEIAEGRSLDVQEIDGASNRGIDEVRQLRETIKYAPATSRFKIYIIDEVHMLTREAFNALLKTLEEPPPHVKFMFATTEPEKVPPTILSRCQRFDLRRIPATLIVKHLKWICDQENVQIDERALFAIAKIADGCMRDAQSALDQLISFCGTRIEESQVMGMFGLPPTEQIYNLAYGILTKNKSNLIETIDSLAAQGKDFSRTLSELIRIFRNLLILHLCGPQHDILDLPQYEIEKLQKLAELAAPTIITDILDTLAHGEIALRESPSRRILLELLIIKATEITESMNLETILQRLKEIKDSLASQPAHKDKTPANSHSTSPSYPKTIKSTNPQISEQHSYKSSAPEQGGYQPTSNHPEKNLAEIWNRTLTAIGNESPFTASFLNQTVLESIDNGRIIISFHSTNKEMLSPVDNQRTRDLIGNHLKAAGIEVRRIEFIHKQTDTLAPQPAETHPSKPHPQHDLKNDPLIREALETFRGQIINKINNQLH